jgi:hypothetical protein
LCPQQPATCPCPQSDRYSLCLPVLPSCFIKINFIQSPLLYTGLSCGLFQSCFPTKILYAHVFSPVHATYSAYLILFGFLKIWKWNCSETYCTYIRYARHMVRVGDEKKTQQFLWPIYWFCSIILFSF